MKKLLKPITCGALALLMFVSVLPPLPARANTQLGVQTLSIEPRPGALPSGSNYALDLKWNRPNASSTVDTTGTASTPPQAGRPNYLGDRAGYYNIYYRNATANQAYPAIAQSVDMPDPLTPTYAAGPNAVQSNGPAA